MWKRFYDGFNEREFMDGPQIMYPMKMKCGGSGKLLKMLQAFYFAQGMTMTACCFFVHFFPSLSAFSRG